MRLDRLAFDKRPVAIVLHPKGTPKSLLGRLGWMKLIFRSTPVEDLVKADIQLFAIGRKLQPVQSAHFFVVRRRE